MSNDTVVSLGAQHGFRTLSRSFCGPARGGWSRPRSRRSSRNTCRRSSRSNCPTVSDRPGAARREPPANSQRYVVISKFKPCHRGSRCVQKNFANFR